jgi:AAA domain, putative AbiEii toxin, Type IV TA system
MYLTRLRARSCKLLHDLEVAFTNADGSPRMWTVFVGENGLCKTTILRAIAMTALGRDFSNNLVDDAPAYLDKRAPAAATRIESMFTYSREHHAERSDPVAHEPPALSSVIEIEPPGSKIAGTAQLSEELPEHDLVVVAGYGVGRVLARPLTSVVGDVPARDRVRSLFEPTHFPIGTGFADHFALTTGEARAREFALCLREALIERVRLPRVDSIELRGHAGASSTSRLIESHRFTMRFGASELRLPAVWLSQGYQAVISLVADIIGHVWLAAGREVPLDEMEGLVLVDELDLHLHPTWQTKIVDGLKRTFPRMQFVVTTHSPMILAGCAREEVWILRQSETGDVTAEPAQVAPALLTAAEMYREFFDLSRGLASELGLKLQRYVSIASNPLRTDAEDAELAVLRAELEHNRVDVDYEPVDRGSAP